MNSNSAETSALGAADDVTRIPPEKKRGGVWVVLGEEAYRIPPLGLLGIQELQDDFDVLKGMGAVPNAAQMDSVFRCIHAAIARNYPSIALEEVREMVDMDNFMPVLTAVLTGSGLQRGAAALGEARASTGASSTPP